MSERTQGVFALRYAFRTASLRGEHFYGHDSACGMPMPIDYYVWAVLRKDDVILFDAGFKRETADRLGARTYLGTPAELLDRLGRDAAEVSVIALSHLHFDHTGCLDSFPEADLLLQARELEFWTSACLDRGDYPNLYDKDDLRGILALKAKGKVKLLDGDYEVRPGVNLHLVGGHTPGMQIMSIDTDSGPIVLASDASHFYENIESDRPYSVVHELPAMYAAFDRVNGIAGEGGVVVPGHDPQVRKRHPDVQGLEGLVVNLSCGAGVKGGISPNGVT